MGERPRHAPGTFSWADLGTTDAAGAKTFYGGLFGWELEDLPVPDAPPYTMARIGGKAVCALYQRHSNRKIRTFSIAFEEAAFNEADYAREVARHLGTVHSEHLVTVREARDVDCGCREHVPKVGLRHTNIAGTPLAVPAKPGWRAGQRGTTTVTELATLQSEHPSAHTSRSQPEYAAPAA